MKKILSIVAIFLVLTGCSLGTDMTNTPTRQVEAYLDSYQKLDDNVLNDLDTLIEDTDYTIEQKARYREVMKKHYSDLDYQIKEEKIDGDKATVDAEVEVRDYSDILAEEPNKDDYKDANGNYDAGEFLDYQLTKLEAATSKVKYTITFHLTKKDNKWVIDDLDRTSMEKIHGIYIR